VRSLVLALLLAGCGTAAPAAQQAPAPSGHLYLAGREPGTLTVVDAAAGTAQTHRLNELGGGDPPYFLAFTGGRLVTFALGRATSFRPDLTDPVSLGEAWFFVPSATPGRVWTTQTRKRSVNLRSVREVGVDGRVTLAHSARPPRWPFAAVDGALILQGRRDLFAWDPVTGRTLRRIPGTFAIAARGSLVASCGCTSALHITDVRTGKRRLVGGRFREASEGAFSPDGRWLAVAAQGAVTVIDLATLDSQRLKPMDPDYHLLAWASSGWLYWNAPGGRIGAWRPGEAARMLPVHVGRSVDMAAD